MLNKYRVFLSNDEITFHVDYYCRTQQEAKAEALRQYPNAKILKIDWAKQ